jgi:HSP20 family protein
MALITWEPSEGLATLRREVDRLFEDFVDGGPRHVWGRGAEPAVEVCDTTEAVVVKAQVPGVSQDQSQVDITDETLTLTGEMQEEELVASFGNLSNSTVSAGILELSFI